MKLLPRKRATPEIGRQRAEAARQGRHVFSYYANRSTDDTTTGRAGKPAAKRKPRWHYLPSIIAALALLISLGYILRLDVNPKISIAGGDHGLSLRPTSTYQQTAKSILNRSWFNRNKLTIDTGGVERQMKQQFPELSEVAVTLPLVGHRPVVELAAVQPVLVLVTKDNQVVVANNGEAVAGGPNLNNAALKDLPRVEDNSGLSLKTGTAALPASQVSFIQDLAAQLKLQKLTLQNLSLPAAPNEVDVRLQGLGYYLKFNTALDVRQQVGSFLAAKQKLDAQHVTPGEYMDVRVEEKVFYK